MPAKAGLPAAALLFLGACVPSPLAAPAAPTFPAKLYALGTEPFWSLEIDGAQLAYSSAENPVKVQADAARRDSGGELTLTANIGGKPVTARVRRETCSDGMSDREYPFDVTVSLAGQVLRGCASPSPLSGEN